VLASVASIQCSKLPWNPTPLRTGSSGHHHACAQALWSVVIARCVHRQSCTNPQTVARHLHCAAQLMPLPRVALTAERVFASQTCSGCRELSISILYQDFGEGGHMPAILASPQGTDVTGRAAGCLHCDCTTALRCHQASP
jgi:hypothetical protein